MNDKRFLSILNTVSRDHRLAFPTGETGDSPSGELLHAWARFLEGCIEQGVDLGDPRWQRLALMGSGDAAQFALAGPKETPTDPEVDFPVGLQLLLGVLRGRDK